MRPFADLVVLELASVLAGPSVGQFLAELGATVLKVESPHTRGDVTRGWCLPTEAETDRPAYFTAINWGKQSLALDLAHPDGRALMHRLAAGSDVVLTSFRPGAAARLGADVPTLRAASPRAVVASISGYGPDAPRAGYDAVVQAESGWMFMNGAPDGPPTKLPVALVDVLAAHQLKQAILVALLERERTGEGAAVHVALFDAAVSALVNQASNWLTAGHSPQRMGSAHPNIAPYGSLLPTADGHALLLAVGTDRQFAHLCAALNLDALPDDARFATNASRVQHRAALEARLAPAIRMHDRDTLLATLHARYVPAGAVRSLPEVFEQPGPRAQVVRAEGLADQGLAAVRQVAFRMDGAAVGPLAPPPSYAADTVSVLRDRLHLGAAEIARLVEDGAIETAGA
ncbi:MAG: CaiB/BaiF CoA-transferase family protein [Bacteroidota bacterium]